MAFNNGGRGEVSAAVGKGKYKARRDRDRVLQDTDTEFETSEEHQQKGQTEFVHARTLPFIPMSSIAQCYVNVRKQRRKKDVSV